MNCLYYGCDKSASHPFTCCSINHGAKFKNIMEMVKSKDLTGYGQVQLMELTPEQLDYYKKLT